MVSKQSLKLTSAWVLALTLAFFSMSLAYAAGITVNSTLDTVASDGSCILREAISNANNDNLTYSDCGAGFGADDITFNLSNNAIITLSSQLPIITSNITIDGSSVANLTISGDSNDRVFYIDSGHVTFNALTITKGKPSSGDGGGIYNQGVVTITNSTLRDNQAVNGGGIYNSGNLVISNSSVISNKSTYSVAFGNGGGGGMYNQGSGRITMTNSTLSGNMANYHGGAIYQDSSTELNLDYVTVANNHADYGADGFGSGGGIYNSSTKKIKISSTMIAKNSDNPGFFIIKDVFGSFTDQGHNLIGISEPIWSTGLIATTTLSGTSGLPLDPSVGPLQNNGGSTDTHALLTGSPAIDKGNNSGAPTTDQRGYTRIMNGTVDIGAYESDSVPVVLTSTIQFSALTYAVNENSGAAVITLTRTGTGMAQVQVDITGGTATVDVDYNNSGFPKLITFMGSQGNQTITLPITDDLIAEGSETVDFTLTAITNSVIGTNITTTLRILDDDVAGVVVNPVNNLLTNEGGTITATFAMTLTSQPTASVIIDLASSVIAEGLPSPTVIIFTPTDWNMPQTVTVTGQDDNVVDGNLAYTIQMTATSGDPFYNGLHPTSVNLLNLDDDAPGITIIPTIGLTTSEWGDFANFNIVLNNAPTTTVPITLTSLNFTEGTVTPTLVTFDVTNWSIPQLITVNGVNDWVMDGNMVYTIETQVGNSNSAYDLLNPDGVTLINLDDDIAGISTSLASGLTTTELGGTVMFSVSLTSEPTATTVISFASSDLTEGVVTPTVITFTLGNWNISQTITITGMDDTIYDDNVVYTVQILPALSADPVYNNLTPFSNVITLINIDNDAPPNIAPIAQNDTLMGLEDTLITPTIFSNDYDRDGYIVPATFNLISPPLHGVITFNITGSVSYLPQPDFNGTDIFTYTIKDDDGLTSNLATVFLTIKAVNDPPTITLMLPNQTVMESDLMKFTLPTSAFYDVDTGDVLTYTAQFLPSWLTFNPNTRTFSGTATNNDLGNWPIQVMAKDLAGAFVTQSFTVTVLNVNNPPFLMQPIPSQTVLENNSFSFIMATHTFTDVDADDTLTYTVTLSDGLPLPSWLAFNPTTRVFSGTPANVDVGAWSIKVIAKDSSLASASTLFTLTVINVNDAPIAQADLATTPEETSITLTVLANDFDPDVGDILTITTVSLPLHGTAALRGEIIIYIPPVNFNGVVTFTYTIIDGHGGTAQAEITVLVGNQGEIGRPDEVVTDEDVPILIDVLANDTHQGTGLSLLTVSVPLHGVTIISGSQVLYTPRLNFYGLDSFMYIVMNGEVADLGLVTVTVKPVTDGLIARDDLATTTQNVSITLQPLANDTDIDQVGLTIQAVSDPQHGIAVVNGNNVNFTPAPDFTGTDTFSYITTNGLLTATAQIVVEVVSAMPPVAMSDFITTTQNLAVTVAVLANDTDIFNLPLELTTIGTPQHGTATLNGTTIIYTPEPDFVGEDYFDYGVTNGNLTNMALVWLEVLPRQVITPTPPITVTPGVTVTWPITWSQTPSTTTIVTPPLHGEVVISNGQVIYLPNPDFIGTEIITITVGDGTVTETIVMVVTVDVDTIAPTFPISDSNLILLTPIQAITLLFLRPMFTWQAAIDNVGVVSYTLIITPLNQVAFVITTTTTSYTPTFDLPPGSYQWTVIAHDAAGNASEMVKPEAFSLKLPIKPQFSFLPIILR